MAKGKAASSASARRGAAKPASQSKPTTTHKPKASSSSATHARGASIPVVSRAVGLEDDRLSTAIAFDTQREWDTVCAKLNRSVKQLVGKTLDDEGVTDQATRAEVERVMVQVRMPSFLTPPRSQRLMQRGRSQTFLAKTLDMMRQNVIIDGRPPPSSKSSSSSTLDAKAHEPFDDRLNQRVMNRQLDLMGASQKNGRKRRLMPTTVVDTLRAAVERENARIAKVVTVEEGDALARWKEGEIRLVNGAFRHPSGRRGQPELQR